jgi:hypothetical protein
MNTPNDPTNPNDAIAILLQVPGLQMDVLAGMSVGCLLRDAIHRALDAEKLLKPSILPGVNAQIGEMAIMAAKNIKAAQIAVVEAEKHKAEFEERLAKAIDPTKLEELKTFISRFDNIIKNYNDQIALGVPLYAQLKNILGPTPIAVAGEGNRIYLCCETLDLARALIVAMGELERLGWLQFAEIFTPDFGQSCVRYFYPADGSKKFERHAEWLRQRLGGKNPGLPGTGRN